MGTKDFWDQVYSEGQANDFSRIEMPGRDDPILNSALDYFGDIKGRKVIDLGCGNGKASLFFANFGANVLSIDVSKNAIGNLKNFCIENRISNITPLELQAMDISMIGQVDFVFGAMILHHIEPFDAFAAILREIIAQGGKAFFWENNAVSSLMIWFRKNVVGKLWIPKYGDNEESPFSVNEVDALRKYFEVNIVYPELLFFRMISHYLLRGHLQRPFELLDDFFFELPWLRKYSYRQYLYLSQKNRF